MTEPVKLGAFDHYVCASPLSPPSTPPGFAVRGGPPFG